MTLKVANDQKLHEDQFAWFAGTMVRNQIIFQVNVYEIYLGWDCYY